MLSKRYTMIMVIQKVSNSRGGWVCTFFLWQTVTKILGGGGVNFELEPCSFPNLSLISAILNYYLLLHCINVYFAHK